MIFLLNTVIAFLVAIGVLVAVHEYGHFWMARRFLPVILPSALLFACGAALTGAQYGWSGPRLRRITASAPPQSASATDR